MSTITYSGGIITPTLVDGYEGTIEARSLVHTIVGRPDPDITMRPAGLRTGTLTLVFASRVDAWSAVTALRVVPRVFTFADDDQPETGMSFVVAGGELQPQLDDATRNVWLVQVPFQEIAV